ncbi:MAG TPA: acyl-CoA dehydrogenase family protein, partial [Usitatibacter sp.]|nr:acyl-CoA dehydrogenase family protein [Usitatibacter sp.]
PVAVEAMECLGGNGYVEEAPLARLYREAPLNGIWEGSANVICLDVLRAIARAFDASAVDARERELQRILTPVAKYWVCKRMVPVAVEAMECLGGNGYVEEAPLARLYREAPLNGIWEGSANVICLDVLRAIARAPESLAALRDEVLGVKDARIERRWAAFERALSDSAAAESQARAAVEALAACAQASLMLRYSDPAAADAFCSARLGEGARSFGTLPAGSPCERLVERALPF